MTSAVRSMHVLNLDDPPSAPRSSASALAVAVELQKTMLSLKGQHMSTDGREVYYNQIKHSPSFSEYEEVAKKLANCELKDLQSEDERKSFFINIYNALTVHGLCTSDPLPASVLELDHFWGRTAYNIGGHDFTLDDIEHGILRGNRPHPLAKNPPFADPDPRKQYALESCDPRVHFALVCGAKSCPAIQVYTAANVQQALDSATRSFCSQEVTVDEERRLVTTSKIFHWYGRDFGSTERDLLQWMCQYLSDNSKTKLERLLTSPEPIKLEATEYNWHLNTSKSVL